MRIRQLRAFMTRDNDRPRVLVAIDTDEGITGWGVEIDEEVLKRDGYIHWQRKVPTKPDGSSGYV